MKQVLPPGMSPRRLDRALKAMAQVVGDDWVFATDLDRDTYLDHFAVDESAHAAAAAVAPLTAEQVQEDRAAGQPRTRCRCGPSAAARISATAAQRPG